MSNQSRFLYLFLNLGYGASIGAGMALVIHQRSPGPDDRRSRSWS